MNLLQVKPFERIFDSSLRLREAQLYGEIGLNDVSYLQALFAHFSDQNGSRRKPVTISVFTGGGSLDASLAIFDLVMAYRKKFPINILAVGSCMSGGVIIMQSATKRLAYPHARFMVHELCYLGGAQSLTAQQNEADEAMRLHKIVREIIASRSQVDLDKLRKKHGPIDTYYDAQRALGLGLIDKIVDSPPNGAGLKFAA
jgi:ATP-dependent Clp protease protease subunit